MSSAECAKLLAIVLVESVLSVNIVFFSVEISSSSLDSRVYM